MHVFARATALLMIALVVSGSASAQTAEWIIYGGTIYTLENDQPSVVDAIAVGQGTILGSGSVQDVNKLADAKTQHIDLHGLYVIPGLVDAHAHLHGLGFALSTVDLRGTVSVEDCIDRARKAHAELPAGAWLRGRAWDQNDWAVQEFPTKEALDEAFGDRPVYFTRVDGHAAWVNSAALRVANVNAATADPEGGEIIRDSATGEPTGVLVDEAEMLVYQHIPEAGTAELERRYRLAIAEAHSVGLVGVHDMGVSLEQLTVLERAEKDGWLDLRLVTYLGGEEVLAEYEGGPHRPGAGAHLWVDGVKFYADGALGSRGAALLEDYSDRPGHTGLLIQKPAKLQELVQQAMQRDLTVTIHAIGDRGNRVALDAIINGYSALRAKDANMRELNTLRPRIEHVQIAHPDDFARFADNGIIASVQPTHCTSDMPWAGERLGDERLVGAYAWRTLLDLGCQLPLGSDFPVEQASPWLGLYASRTRQMTNGEPDGGWSPEQALSSLEALLGFTVWTARAIGAEGWGSLAVGDRADLIIVDKDPLGDDPKDLLETTVELTMVDGEVVYRSQ